MDNAIVSFENNSREELYWNVIGMSGILLLMKSCFHLPCQKSIKVMENNIMQFEEKWRTKERNLTFELV